MPVNHASFPRVFVAYSIFSVDADTLFRMSNSIWRKDHSFHRFVSEGLPIDIDCLFGRVLFNHMGYHRPINTAVEGQKTPVLWCARLRTLGGLGAFFQAF